MHSYESKNHTRFLFSQGVTGDTVKINGIDFNGDDLVEFVMVNYLLMRRLEKLENTRWEDLE